MRAGFEMLKKCPLTYYEAPPPVPLALNMHGKN